MEKIKKSLKNLKASLNYLFKVFQIKLSLWSVYRLKLVVWIVSGIVEPIIWSVLWYATAQGSDSISMTGAQILSYYLFTALMVRITRSWTFDTLRKQIKQGKYTKYLLWPKGVVLYRIGSDWANRVVTVSVLLPIWGIWLAVLNGRGLFEIDMESLVLFMVALLNATILRFCLDLVLGHVALFWEKMDGIAQIYWSAFRLLGGVTVPLLILPVWAFNLIKLLPFRYIVSFPIEIFQGLISDQDILKGFAISGGWLILEIIALSIIFKYGLRKYEAVGI